MVSAMNPRSASTRTVRIANWLLLSVALSGGSLTACSRPPARTPTEQSAQRQQELIESAAAAWQRVQGDPRFAEASSLLGRAQAVMIFPHLIKASFIFGGEGGSGVLLARSAAGGWSNPAFYSLGAPSVGLQIGFQEATVVLFVMQRDMLERLLDGELTLGKNVSAVLGARGERGQSEAELVSKPIYALVDAGGVYAGISLDGYVIAPRQKHNVAYYGEAATPRAILIERTFHRAEASVLVDALTTNAGRATPAPSSAVHPGAASPPSASPPSASPPSAAAGQYRECSPESRQAQACTMIYAPVCAEVDTGVRCVAAPCPASRAERTFENACRACSEKSTYGYRDGACAAP